MPWYEILMLCYAIMYVVKDMPELPVYTCTFIHLYENIKKNKWCRTKFFEK